MKWFGRDLAHFGLLDGRLPADHLDLAEFVIEPRLGEAAVGIGNGGEQQAGIGVLRIAEHAFGLAPFDDLAGIHDHDVLGHVAGGGDVMGDVEQRQAELALHVVEQVEDAQAHRDVEHGGRLVGDDHLGIDRQGAGDADALALAARQLVRIFARRSEPGRASTLVSSSAMAAWRSAPLSAG